MRFKTHICQSLKNIILLFIVLLLFCLAAIGVSDAKYFTAIHYIRLFVPIWIIMSMYFYVFSSTSVITVSDGKLKLEMKFGRNRHSELNISDITAIEKKDVFANLLGAKRIVLSSKDISSAETIVLFNHYLFLSKNDAAELMKSLK